MADSANAAQMAKRKILAAKKNPRRALGGSQYGSSPAPGGFGALQNTFGQSLPTGGFNPSFAPGSSMPTASFGASFGAADSGNNGMHEESAREEQARNKGNVNFNKQDDSVPMFAPNPFATNASGNNPFGSNMTNGSGSIFGGQAQPATSGGIFGGAPAATPSFDFNFSSVPAPASTNGMFGHSTSSFNTPKPTTSSSFDFGQQNGAQAGNAATPSASFPGFFGQKDSSQPQTQSPGFGASQPTSGAINFFGSTPQGSAPPAFSMPSPATPGKSLFNLPATTPKFNFGTSQPQQSTATPYNFGVTSTAPPSRNDQVKTPGTINFGAAQTGQPGEKPTTPGIFDIGGTKSALASGNASTPGSFDFGKQQTAQPVSNPGSVVFGGTKTAESSETTTTPSVFKLPQPEAPTPNSSFASKSQQADAPAASQGFVWPSQTGAGQNAASMFSTPQPAKGNPMSFGTVQPEKKAPLFGTPQGKPTPEPFTIEPQRPTESPPSFTPAPTANTTNAGSTPFKPSSRSAIDDASKSDSPGTLGAYKKSSNVFDNVSGPSSSLFNLNKPVGEQVSPPITDDSSAKSHSLSNTQPPALAPAASTTSQQRAPTPQANPFSQLGANAQSQSAPKSILKATNPTKATASPFPESSAASITPGSIHEQLFSDMRTASTITDEHISELVPSQYSAEQIRVFAAAARMRALNIAMSRVFENLPFGIETDSILDFYDHQKSEIYGLSNMPLERKKQARRIEDTVESPAKRHRGENAELNTAQAEAPAARASPDHSSRTNSSQTEAPNASLERSSRHGSPEKHSRSSNSEKSSRLANPEKKSATPREQPYLDGSFYKTPTKYPPPTAAGALFSPGKQMPPLTFTPSDTIPASMSPAKSKRKAESQLTKDEFETDKARGSTSTNGGSSSNGASNTSALIKNILDSPAASTTPKSIKKPRSMVPKENSADETPRFNPFGNLSIPASPTPSAPKTAVSAASSFTPKAANSVGPAPFSPFTTKPAAAASTPAPANLFSTITKASSTTPAPASIHPPALSPSSNTPAPANGFVFKPSGNTPAASNPFALKPAKDTSASAPTGSPFIFKPAGGPSAGPVDFMAQFAKKSQDAEEKKMQDAFEEDYDSDDGLSKKEWEAEWKKKRQVELKALEASKIKAPKFGLSQNSSSGGSAPTQNSTADAVKTPIPSVFSAPPKPAASSFEANAPSIFSTQPKVAAVSFDGSTSVGRGSVLSSFSGSLQTLDKPANADPSNIFGHVLPDNSGHEDEDDSDDGQNDDQRDPNYEPNGGSSGPGTPVEETGEGIASAKKSSGGLDRFSQATPKSAEPASLMSRITKAAADTPKPNFEPPKSSPLFGRVSLPSPQGVDSKTSTESPAPRANLFSPSPASNDNTWKPDSPIKFGKGSADALGGDGVSGTPATANASGAVSAKPTASPFAGLFGNATPKPATNMFTPSSGFGFSFGQGPAPSLLPSTAAATAANSSQATSPGASSNNDANDPDAEQHEQIDLSKGGPGEEDEDKIHEIRAKASKFEGQWAAKGTGVLRVLKHKESGVTRLLLRGDGLGNIVLNKALLSAPCTLMKKTVKITTAGENGESLETWLLQVKTEAFAAELNRILDENRPSS